MISTALAKHKGCRALALEGGGDKGAYEIGALRGILESLDPSEVEYDVITGISVGAINAFGLSLFPTGKEWEASDFMLNFWQDLTQEDVFQTWDTSYYDAIF